MARAAGVRGRASTGGAMSEEFWMMAIAAVFSGLGNLVQVWRGGQVRKDRDRVRSERELAESVARALGRRYMSLDQSESAVLEAVRQEFGAEAGDVLDRTVGIVISESMKQRALGGEG